MSTVKLIPLSQSLFAIVDDEDYEWLSQYKWTAASNGTNNVYAMRTIRGEGNKCITIFMHREILNPVNGLLSDHINGDGLDNRRCNLRVVTARQNNQNRHITKTSNYPGVSWHKTHKKWAAYFTVNRKISHIGYFEKEIDAYNAYKLAIESLGEVLL